MAFRFSLDPVLKVRKHQETLQKQKLAAELQKKQEIHVVRQQTQEKLTRYLDSSHQSDVSCIHDMQRHGRHMEQVHGMILKLGRELNEAESLVLQEREKLAEVHRDRHILEKVKEGELELFRKRLERIEQKSMDEIAMRSYGR